MADSTFDAPVVLMFVVRRHVGIDVRDVGGMNQGHAAEGVHNVEIGERLSQFRELILSERLNVFVVEELTLEIVDTQVLGDPNCSHRDLARDDDGHFFTSQR